MTGSSMLRVSLLLLLLDLVVPRAGEGNLAKLPASLHIIGADPVSDRHRLGHVERDVVTIVGSLIVLSAVILFATIVFQTSQS